MMPSRIALAVRHWLRNSSRQYLFDFNSKFAREAAAGARLLDAGAGSAPYRDLFWRQQYESCDIRQVDQSYVPTYLCDLTNIPVENGRYDYVVMNQVLEHIQEPSLALREINRVLKDDGRLICSTPLFYQEHEIPRDYFRYTRYGLNFLFSNAGFSIDTLEWLEGYFGTIGYQMEMCYRSLPVRPSQVGGGVKGLGLSVACVALKSLSLAGAGLMYRLDRTYKLVDYGMPKNYVLIARKKQNR